MYESNVSSESNVSVLELPLCKNGPTLRHQDLEETLRRKKLLVCWVTLMAALFSYVP